MVQGKAVVFSGVFLLIGLVEIQHLLDTQVAIGVNMNLVTLVPVERQLLLEEIQRSHPFSLELITQIAVFHLHGQ